MIYHGKLKALRFLALGALCVVFATAQTQERPEHDVEVRQIHGWTVHVGHALIEGPHARSGARALAMLANHLERIAVLVEGKPLERLRKAEIWIEHEHGKLRTMQYHPSVGWLRANGHDERLAKKVHIPRARDLLSRAQLLKHPAVILHELAHAYHDQVLGFDDRRIKAAYREARESGAYERVLAHTGKTVRHYALQDHKEYFAEGTEAWFYRNDFYPFVRAEMATHDARLHALLEEIWAPDAGPAPAREPTWRRRPNILFCIADDWGWPHASAYGDKVVRTPAFDRIAAEGVLFDHAYVASPSCTPSRNAILTGQHHWRLGHGANLWSSLSVDIPVYPLLLEKAGYHVGHWRKSWGPGRLAAGGYEDTHPAGRRYPKGFEQFLAARPEGAPFCFWLGAHDPHRPYELGSGRAAGMSIDEVAVPAFYPDVEQIRSDIADYYVEVQRFDRDVGEALRILAERGELENTIVVMTGDHGMPFPRCKSNIYDMGVRVPLAIRWGAEVAAGRRIADFVSLVDLAPTFLELSGVAIPAAMTGQSLLSILRSEAAGRIEPERDHVIFGKERHVPCRPDHSGYPCRGIRTDRWAFIHNFEPDRWPVGDPPIYGDTDPARSAGKSITKSWLLEHKDDPDVARYYELSFGKRPEYELYDMVKDPDQLTNLAAMVEHADVVAELSDKLTARLRATADPRIVGGAELFDRYPYFGGSAWQR